MLAVDDTDPGPEYFDTAEWLLERALSKHEIAFDLPVVRTLEDDDLPEVPRV
jgi:hypothetical protein